MKISDSITKLPGVGANTAGSFGKLGVKTIKDLLFLLPNRIEDQSNLAKIASLRSGEEAVISGKISKVFSRRTKRGSLLIEARITDESGSINAAWFNQRFLLSQLKDGEQIMLFGSKKIAPSMGNPFIVKKIIKSVGYSPIYPATQGLYQGVIQRIVKQAVPLAKDVPDILPPQILKGSKLIHRSEALMGVHDPKNQQELDRARRLFAFEELLGLALSVGLNKQEQRAKGGDKLIIDTDYLKRFVAKLPFTLTAGQRQAAWGIIKGMANGYPANRLLYGEVGSGKTVVSLIAAMAIVRAGGRVLILVPTTTLAAQQAKSIQEMVGKDLRVSLITGHKKETIEADIIVGTHALLNIADQFDRVGLVIIDEQQRFGVRQRQILLRHHGQAHLLLTTATPIPRSLAQTVFGNLEITYLLDKPAHQQRVTTKLFLDEQRPSVVAEIRRRLSRSEPGYVICPAIAKTDQPTLLEIDERKSVIAEAKKLAGELPGAKIAAIHGKIPADQRVEILGDFMEGRVDVLVSTTVVEVGIDNPNATWMIVENAEMFGLSTLHQLRGRVGRGQKASVCFLSQTLFDEKAGQRLEMLEKSDNGLELAEADLSLRGPGEILGSEQSGLPSLRFASLGDKKMVTEVFALADKIVNDGIEKYPTLKKLLVKVDGLAAS
ncbi:MAG: ATP-dependent DNA helicase RecG [Patescibacteria group bacterium]